MPVRINYLKCLPVNVQADKNSYLFDGFKRLIQLMESTCTKISNKNVEVLNILKGFPESIEQCGARLVCEKCQIGLHKAQKYHIFV